MRTERSWFSALVPLSLALFALAATAPGFGNQFTSDDLPLIVKNDAVHSLDRPASFFTQPYWNDPFPHALYRPLATAGLALQWEAGGGKPRLYRWVSTALLAASAIAVFMLSLQVMPVFAAWAAAALFAVHPLHSEAVALGVNQGELAVALLLLLAMTAYLRERRSGDLRPGTRAAVIVLFIAASLFRENGLVLPLLLLAAEATVIIDNGSLGARVRRLRPFYVGLGLGGALVLLGRVLVLRGDVVGTFTADALHGAGILGRGLTMLGVVPKMGQLLIWPSNLQADYGPNEIVRAEGWGMLQTLGTALLILWIAAIALTRKRAPALALALCWVAIAVLPISNFLVPTGVTLAERTLFLASAGVTMAAGWLLGMAWNRGVRPPRLVQWGSLVLLAILLVAGLRQSRARARVWQDQRTLLHQTVVDAPRSYSAHLALTRFLEDSSTADAAADQYRRAVAIRPSLVEQDRTLADQYRLAGLCRPAVRYYRRVLAVLPADSALQASLSSCLLTLPRTVP